VISQQTQWMDLTTQQLVRYEALFTLLQEIQALDDVGQVAKRVATQWKYFANVAAWRLVMPGPSGFQLIDGARGQASVQEVPALSSWDALHWTQQRPGSFAAAQVPHQPPPPEHLQDMAEVRVLPLLHKGRCVAVLSTAARQVSFTELDLKFIRLFGSHLVNHMAGIVMRRQAMELLISKATHDALTGLLNRGTIIERLNSQAALAARTGQPLSLVLADIDHFKRINDEHGHLAGDAVLREVAMRLQACVREGDSLGRFGGEEFLFVLYPCGSDEAAAAAERFRAALVGTPMVLPGEVPPVTLSLSLGTASGGPGELSSQRLLRLADDALYASKRAGRNCVTVSRGEPESSAARQAPEAGSAVQSASN
jgi:diguanylate cyclase (GGDEF)-like protein